MAEDLALRKIEASFDEPIRRQAAIAAHGGDVKFDGIVIQNDLVTGIEVLFCKDVNIHMERVYSRISEAMHANNFLSSIGKRFLFIIVLVIDDNTTQNYASAIALKRKVKDGMKRKFNLDDMRIQSSSFKL